ncbi:hypothetical protein [Nitrospina gracilis]|uniref:hypothetical protein n=1 Tax=Nitrospina gracilis TaxID=35801 RepID=UPI001F1D2DCA|nr:hypothetical protein [Nitrospina gracilis]MCF8719339.1 ubiquinol-cytochrome c reductase cytochrome b subunit [Nitrospina gracilis Nb-211]
MYKKPKYPKGMRFYPTFVLEDVMVICLFMAVFFGLICFFPDWFIFGDAQKPADAFDTPAHIKPEWYFLASYQLLRIIPSELGALILQTAGVLAFIFLPFIDRSPEPNIFKRPLFLPLVVLCIASFVGLTLWGYLA